LLEQITFTSPDLVNPVGCYLFAIFYRERETLRGGYYIRRELPTSSTQALAVMPSGEHDSLRLSTQALSVIAANCCVEQKP
jgi:hypothetical protein